MHSVQFGTSGTRSKSAAGCPGGLRREGTGLRLDMSQDEAEFMTRKVSGTVPLPDNGSNLIVK